METLDMRFRQIYERLKESIEHGKMLNISCQMQDEELLQRLAERIGLVHEEDVCQSSGFS